MYRVMANGIRTGDPRGFNKERCSKFHEGSRVQETPEEGWRTYRPKRCGNNNKDEDNSRKNLNDKNTIFSFIDNIIFHFALENTLNIDMKKKISHFSD